MSEQFHQTDDQAVFGIFRHPREVNAALSKLQAAGVNRSLVKLLPPKNQGVKDFHQKQRTSVKGGMIAGAIAGGIVFFLISLFITINLIKTPWLEGVGLHGFSRPESQTLFVLLGAVAGMVLGGAAGALIGVGTPEPAQQRYASYSIAGGTLLSVRIHDSESANLINSILESTRAQDISTLNEADGWRSIHEELHLRTPKKRGQIVLRKNEYVDSHVH